MMTYEQDPDVVRWGLQFFESDPYANYAYSDAITAPQLDVVDYYDDGGGGGGGGSGEQQCKEEGNHCSGFVPCNVENDELIAHALQEELSQLAVAEAPESGPDKDDDHDDEDDDDHDDHDDQHLQVNAFQQHWAGQAVQNYVSTGLEGRQEEAEADGMGPSSLSPSPQNVVYNGDEWLHSLELTDGYAFNGEVGKWLNEMVPIPHVPKINGEIPSVDEATLDHQRLLDRLQVYDLVEHKVQGDGNCQFRALSDQFYRTPEHHEFVRHQVVNQLKSHPEIYEGYVPMAYGDYLEKMIRSGEWGDHVTLQAAADMYGVKIIVITSFKNTCYIEILPIVERSKRVILLSFWAEVHYNSIFPRDVLAYETKKKRWRTFRTKHWDHQLNADD